MPSKSLGTRPTRRSKGKGRGKKSTAEEPVDEPVVDNVESVEDNVIDAVLPGPEPEEHEDLEEHDEHEEQAQNSGEDTDTISVTSAIIPKNKAKRMKVVSNFTPQEENSMIVWSEVHHVLYNKKLVSYKNTAEKERLWMDKAAAIDKGVVMLKTWYTSLHTLYS